MAGRARAFLVAVTAPALWLAGPAAGSSGAATPASARCPAWVNASPVTATPPSTTSTPVTPPPPPTTTTPATPTSLRAGPLARADAASVGDVMVGPREAVVSVTATVPHVAVVVQYKGAGQAFVCTRPRLVGGEATGFTIAALRPSSRYGFRVAVEEDGTAAFGPVKSFVTLPSGRIAEGVSVGSVAVGRLNVNAAIQKVAKQVGSAVSFTYAGAFWRAPASRLGASSNAARLVRQALVSEPGSTLPAAKIAVKSAPLRAYVAGLARRFDHEANTPSVRLVGKHAVITPLRPVVRVDTTALMSKIVSTLHGVSTGRIVVPIKTTAVASQTQQRAVVVRLASQTLTAYVNGRAILTTPVTTGRPALPTPIGSFSVQFKASPYVFHSPWPAGNVFYYPPTPVTWAMEFYDGDFLHDDPAEPTSDFGADSQNGYFASHGCVHVPHSVMAYLYNWLPVGAPVIVADN